jgi:O-antigen/teichoic acid export membrane protein
LAAGLTAQLAIKVLSFAFSIYVVRTLGAETFGQYAAVLAFGAMFAFVSDLGLSAYSVREVARLQGAAGATAATGAVFGNLLVLRLLLSLLAMLLMLGVAWLTGRPAVMLGALALGGLGLVLYGAQGSAEAVLSGLERLDLVAIAKTVYQALIVLAGALALILGFGYYGLIGATLIGVAVLTGLTLRSAWRQGVRPASPRPASWPALLRASLPFGVIAFTLGLSYKFDSVVLNISHGDTETGYYSAAYNLVFTTVVLSNVLNTALYPSLTRHAQLSPDTVDRVSGRFLRYLLLLSAPMAVGASLLAGPIIALLFGEAFAPAAEALRVLAWVIPLMFVSEFLGYLVLIRGQERHAARAVLVSTAINVGLNLLLVPWFGLRGAAAMTVFTELVLVAQYCWFLRRSLRSFDWHWILVRPLLAAGALALIVAALHFLPVLAVVLVGGLAYAGALLVLRVVGRDEVQFIRRLQRSG